MRQPSRVRRILFLCWLIVHYNWMSASNLSLPEDLNKWCPYTKFCDLEPSQKVTHEVVLYENVMLCCEFCSCSEQCGMLRNCCSDQIDHYRVDETLNTTCRQLIIKYGGNAGIQEHFFHIIDQCPDVSESCSDRPAAPWGSYHPVFSRTNYMLYYNIWCAMCHNQTDTVAFTTTIQRRTHVDSYSEFLTDILNGKAHGSESFVRFVAPGETNVHPLICYPFIIRDCNPRSRHLEELRKLCQSFNATYHDGMRTYGNVYCYVCSYNNKPMEEILQKVQTNGVCDSTFSKVYDARNRSPFTFLLNPKITEMTTYDGAVDDSDEAFWCEGEQTQDEKNCRRIYCPEGQFRFHGECTYLGDTFFVKSISVAIVLRPATQIPIDTLSDVMSGGATGTTRRQLLKPYWFSNWDLQLLYKATEPGDHVEYFVANLYSQLIPAFNPLALFYHVDKALREPWSIVVRNTSYTLEAELDTNLKYEEYIEDGNYIPLWLRYITMDDDKPIKANQMLRELHHVTVNPQLGNFVITRMFYCKQVELLSHEYRIENRNLYLVRKGAYMGHGSFVQVQDGIFTRYRVCLSDLFDGRSSGCVRLGTLYGGLVLRSVLFLTLFVGNLM